VDGGFDGHGELFSGGSPFGLCVKPSIGTAFLQAPKTHSR
jgi:hypothetical protein